MSTLQNETTQPDMGAHALAYIRRGWAVVPLWWVEQPDIIDPETGEVCQAGACGCHRGKDCGRSTGKHPHNQHGSKEPLTTGLAVETYWNRFPRCNIGLATGRVSGIVVMDIDPGHNGWWSMELIWKKHGPPGLTPISVTGGQGRHVLFACPERGEVKNAVGHMPGIDIRGDGGLIVAPPSAHLSGERYFWHPDGHPRDCVPEPFPKWMHQFLDCAEHNRKASNGWYRGQAKYGREFDPAAIPPIEDGKRNITLLSITGRLIRDRREHKDALQVVLGINKSHCKPPIERDEVEALVKKAYRYWWDTK